MEQTAVEWLIERLMNGQVDNKMLETAKEMEEKQSQDYAEFCINCDRKNYPIVDFESYLKL